MAETTSVSNASASQTSIASANGVLGENADSQTFLLLLVTQMQNQDPLNPQDPTEFVSQLAQFSSLEQLLGIHESLQTIEINTTPAETVDSQA